MKKFLLIALSALAFSAMTAFAQDVDPSNPMFQALPNDPAVRVGHLDNGLTYYLRYNALPEHRAEFYLATNVGGIQETPDQDGLAHFLEHMCFNGTEHFPGKGILDYLRSIGAEFGRNINASTGFEETQYMLNNMPVERETVVDSCLLVLADYSHYVTNAPEEIDAERGVIIEERRARRNAQWRLLERSLPYFFGDCKYATCTLIGQQESLESFKPESLHNFYKTWYYPGNQAVVVVGDIDLDRTEQKIREIFGPIPANPDPKEKDVIVPPAHSEPVVGVLTDPEETNASISLLWMDQAMPEEYNPTAIAMMQNLLKRIISNIMSERFEDITSDPASPYLSGSFSIGSVIYENTEAVMADVTLKEDNILGGYKAFLEEVERLRRFGVADDEVERAKANILTRYENMVKRAATRKNAELVRPLLSNFFDKTPYMEPEAEYEMVKSVLQQFNAMIISMVVKQLPMTENLTILYTGPEKEGIATPTQEQLLALFAEVQASDIKPSEKNAVAESFLDPATLKGSKVKKTESTLYGATKWTLKNGITVYVKPTKFSENQILFNIYKDGGLSLIDDADIDSFNSTITSVFAMNCGVGPFSGTDVSKMLSGKNLSVNPYIDSYQHGINGQATIKDLETAFQILYLMYTQPRFDEKEWENSLSMLRSQLPNMINTPDYIFASRMMDVIFGHNPRHQQISMETLDRASLDTYARDYRMLTQTAAKANMTIVGDVDLETLKPLVEKYIGSLPAKGKASKWIDRKDDFVPGLIVDDFKTEMTTPQTTVLQLYTCDMPYSAKVDVALDIIEYVLDMRYVTSLREEEGGTYGASTSAATRRRPKDKVMVQTYFNCNPALADRLRELAVKGITELATDGPTADEMNSALLNLKKNLPESRISNSYWANRLENYIDWGEDTDAAREKALEQITADDVKVVLQGLLGSNNFIEIIQRPTKDAE